jgi:hypothetical protein
MLSISFKNRYSEQMKQVLGYLQKRGLLRNILDGVLVLCFCIALVAAGWALAIPIGGGLWVFTIYLASRQSYRSSQELKKSGESQVAIDSPVLEPVPVPVRVPVLPLPEPVQTKNKSMLSLSLQLLPGQFGIARLEPNYGVPPWVLELLGPDQEALEARLVLTEIPNSATGLPAERTASKIKRKKEDASRLVALIRTGEELSLVGPWWMLSDRWNQVEARRSNPGPKTKKGEVLPALSIQYSSFLSLEGPWAAFRIEGQFSFSITGVLASVSQPLAQVGVSILTISTWNTDYILVPDNQVHQAKQALLDSGHSLG